MGTKARQYTPTTIKRLFMLSGNKCASPGCIKQLISGDRTTIISKICHIEAADIGGNRYNPEMTDDDRRAYENLFLLCDEHHSIIDNPSNEKKYPVEMLAQWKSDHEEKMFDILSLKPSLLSDAVNAISKLNLDEESDLSSNGTNKFNISQKIIYNSVIRNKYLIDKYKVFYGKINTLYNELETQGSFRKQNLLRYINKLYLDVVGKYTVGSDNLQKTISDNSDNIIEDIQEILLSRIKEVSRISEEDGDFGVAIIIVDAFMRCKILEEPK